MHRTTLMLALGALSLLVVAPAQASGPAGAYGIVERVVTEPEAGLPERIQVWGAFVLLDKKYKKSTPQWGYLYFSLTGDEKNDKYVRNVWKDLKKMAGTGKVVAFGRPGVVDKGLRPVRSKTDKPIKYPIAWGAKRYHSRSYRKQLAALPKPVTPAYGKKVDGASVELVARNIIDKELKVTYRFEIVASSGEKETSKVVAPGKTKTSWKPKMAIVPGKTYTWKVWVVEGEKALAAATSTFSRVSQ